MKENNNIKKVKVRRVLIVGVTFLIAIVIGATYAYYSAYVNSNYNTKYITVSTGTRSSILLDGTSASLTLGTITGSDMVRTSKDIVYYAGPEKKTLEPTEVTIGVASYDNMNDRNVYRCTYTLSLTHTGSPDLIDKFLSNNYTNKSAGQIILTVNGVEYDLNSGFPSTITGTIDVSRYENASITVGLRFVNLSNVDQEYLTNTDGYININIPNNGFICDQVGTLELAYWGYEKNTNDNPVYSNTAQNKVGDYHDLHWGPTTFTTDVSLVFDNAIFSTLADCETSIEDMGNIANISNVVCNESPTTGYILNVDFVASSRDTEQECTAYTNYVPNSRCSYNSTTEKWDVISNMKYPFETSTECQRRLGIADSALIAYNSQATLSCDLASNTPTFYYQTGEYSTDVDTMSACETMVTAIEEAEDMNDLMVSQDLIDMGFYSMMAENPSCSQPQMSIFVKEKTTSSATNVGVFTTEYQICGLINNNALCYTPIGITNSNIEETLSPYSNYFNCDYSSGTFTCIDDQDNYEAHLTYSNNIYTSNLTDHDGFIGCDYDGSNISCYTLTPEAVVESDHDPYANNIDNVTYYENTFTGATSITVRLTYQTEGTDYDWVYLYQDVNTIYNNKKYGGRTKKTETIEIPGDYLKIVFKTDNSSNAYYGFRAEIYPNY